MNVIEKIKIEYNNQTNLRKKISDFILKEPLKVSFFSLNQFSKVTDVMEPTIISYCKSIGFASFSEFKQSLQSYVIQNFSQKDRLTLLASESKTFDSLYMKIVAEEEKSLKNLYRNNPPLKIATMLKYINNATSIYIAAYDAAKPFADYLASRLNNLGHPCTSLNLKDSSKILNLFPTKEPIEKNLLISITITPYSPLTLSITHICRKFNMPIISISDSKYCPIEKDSDANFVVPTELFGLTNSPTSMYSLINLIVILLQYNPKKPKGSALNSQ